MIKKHLILRLVFFGGVCFVGNLLPSTWPSNRKPSEWACDILRNGIRFGGGERNAWTVLSIAGKGAVWFNLCKPTDEEARKLRKNTDIAVIGLYTDLLATKNKIEKKVAELDQEADKFTAEAFKEFNNIFNASSSSKNSKDK